MKLKITSKDKFGQDSSKKYPCKKDVKSEGQIYEYEDEYGENKIFAYKNKVIIKRKGQVTATQKFQKNKKSIFMYKTPYTKSKFKIETHKLKLNKDKIELEYSILDMKNILINKLKVNISTII
ncbi:MAG: DUF1934 domain-containing protein [Fusobacteriota bacterium]